MAHAQKPDFVFRRNGRVHLNRWGASVQSATGSRGVRISGSNAGYTMFRGSVKSTGYPLHSPVSPSLPFPCVTVFHHISTGLYPLKRWFEWEPKFGLDAFFLAGRREGHSLVPSRKRTSARSPVFMFNDLVRLPAVQNTYKLCVDKMYLCYVQQR
jgi:hypothetical protein